MQRVVKSVLMLPVLATLSVACSGSGSSEDNAGASPDSLLVSSDGSLQATIRRTTGGVPHITADDLTSVAFGSGYVQAQDNVCVIAEVILKANGERALYFGPGSDNANIISDFSYRALILDKPPAMDSLSAETSALVNGFVAGYNRYLADTPANDLPPACNNQPWVKAISPEELFNYYRIVARFASGDVFARGAIFAAVPPGVTTDPVYASAKQSDTASFAVDVARLVEPIAADNAPESDAPASYAGTPKQLAALMERKTPFANGASNAWGIGGALTENGRGALLANPHFPYAGASRFYQLHLTVPGYYNVNGAALLGYPIPQIGFNENIGWSHTVSTGRRFTIYDLELTEDGTGYTKDGETIAFEAKKISVQVGGGATPVVLERDVYFSQYGPMIAPNLMFNGVPAWGEQGTAYTYRDANASALKGLDTWLQMGRSGNLEDFQKVFEGCGTTFWSNSVFADKEGNAFYIESSSVPDLSETTLAQVVAQTTADPGYSFMFQNGFTVLNGRTSQDDWVEGDCNGVVPYERKPKLLRNDFVQNSNDSHWQTNSRAPLAGYSVMYGHESDPVNARTQLGLRMLLSPDEPGNASHAPGGSDGLFNAQELLDVIWSDRGLYAETFLDEVRSRCTAIGNTPVNLTETTQRSVQAGCSALAAWDGTYGINSQGAHVFRTYLAQLLARSDVDFDLNYDPANPADTSYTFTTAGRGTADDPLMQTLGRALDLLDTAQIAYDAPLGSVQTWRPSGGVTPALAGASQAAPTLQATPIPWHGGTDVFDGSFNAVDVVAATDRQDSLIPKLLPLVVANTGGLSTTAGEGWSILFGTSWHFGLEFTSDGPLAYGLLSYGQSTDPRSDYFTDQGLAYSQKQARKLLYTEAEIAENVIVGSAMTLEDKL